MVGSHCIGDGGGAFLTVFEAVNGLKRDLGYPQPQSRPRLRAILADAKEAARSVPEVARTVAEAARQARQRKRDSASTGAPARNDVAGRDNDGTSPPLAGYAQTNISPANPNAIEVHTRDKAGANEDADFHLIVVCP